MVLDILKVPDSRLTMLCKPVRPIDLNHERLGEFINNLTETMYANEGVGLAAPQVGVLQRIFVMDVREGKMPFNPIVFINPEVLVKRGETVDEEGCLSIPDTFLMVKRAYSVHIAAVNLNGENFSVTLRGMEARVAQHEIDHLDGILFTDRAIPTKSAARK